MKLISLILIIYAILLSGCSSTTRVDHIPKKDDNNPRNLVVFFDGTSNDESSNTNVAKLHNMVTLQDRHDISTTYIKGVGTGIKVIGMAMGWGQGKDVREAYLYLLENYNPRYDNISIFGFSRGAYTSRILAALLYTAGIPDVRHLNKKERKSLVKDIYSTYKSKKTIEKRRDDIAKMMIKKWGKGSQYTPRPVNVKFLGLWETVEALGWPDLKENIDEPNERYADQLCNIENAAHALAIDDNRARIFTPLLLSRKHLRDEACDKGHADNKNKIHEVWFSGAHSDVGGGYKDTEIDGVSLNWMLDMIEGAGLHLVPEGSKVYSDYLGKTHNPEGGIFGLLYRARNRNIPCYTETKNTQKGSCTKDKYDINYRETSTPASSPLKIHQSVLDRLCVKPPENHESFWFREPKYENCLSCDTHHRGYVTGDANGRCRQNIEIVGSADTMRYKFKEVTKKDNYCDYSAYWDAHAKEYKDTKSCNYTHNNIFERAQQRLKKINLNQSKTSKEIIVYADRKNDRTGIYLSKNHSYRFEIEGIKDWVDYTIKADPESGRSTYDLNRSFSTNILSLLAKPLTYAPSSGYMELLGKVGNQQFKLGRLAKSKTLFTPNKDGELLILVNEPRYLKSVYKNNFGVLKLIIHVE